MAIKTISEIGLEQWQSEYVQHLFDQGMRCANLGDQPAPWVLHGLRRLEEGKTLTATDVEDINLAGGTDHPDPWVGRL